MKKSEETRENHVTDYHSQNMKMNCVENKLVNTKPLFHFITKDHDDCWFFFLMEIMEKKEKKNKKKIQFQWGSWKLIMQNGIHYTL